MMSEATTVKVFDGHGFSHTKTLDGQFSLGEVRHANTMTEDRRDYGALYYNLGLGADRVQRFETLKALREETIKERMTANADNQHQDPLDRFTPSYASSYLQRLAVGKGKNLQKVKEQLYACML